MAYPLHKIVLFEYDKPIDLDDLLNAESGIWSWVITNELAGVTDDYAVIGYYQYQQTVYYSVKSLVVDKVSYSPTTSLADCRVTNKSFYYDTSFTKIYIHFDSFEPPLNQEIFFGGAVGYSKMPDNVDQPYFNDVYYEPRLLSVPGVQKSIDPLFFGLLKYFTGSVTLINKDGEFDDWRSRNLYGQPARVMVGDVGDAYLDFDTAFEGFIADDNRDFDEFTIEIEDPRRALTQPIAQNTITITNWVHIKDENEGKVLPVAYGTIRNAESICLNEDEGAPDFYTFLICDTEFNLVDSLDKIYVDGTETAITGAADLTAGTFTMTFASVTGSLGDVTIDFTATDFDNGVEIIKDLMLNYDDKNYVASFWDLTETAAAVTDSRSTSLYIDEGNTKLSDGIESVCFDIDGRFFVKNSGLYTVRIYDADRTPLTKELECDEFFGPPSVQNNGSEYLSSVIVEYSKDVKDSKYLTYENTDYQTEAFNRYKRLKVGKFKTNLATLTAATDKSETIMNISKEVQDIIDRTTSWDNFGIEPSDFVIGSPTTRQTETASRGIYEVMSVKPNMDDFKIDLSLRYVTTGPAEKTYSTIDDNNDLAIDDNNDKNLTGRLT